MRESEAVRLRDVGRRLAVPRTRDPFINTPLLPLGKDEQGSERFWCSTYNANVGPTCALISDQGECKLLRPGLPHAGFYSAVAEDADTLWLCGFTSHLVRLRLSEGRFDTYETGVPSALMFQGMVYDQPTRKIFAASYAGGFSFDLTHGRSTVYERQWQGRCMRFSWPNGDGTWSIYLHQPAEIIRWDPQEDVLLRPSVNDRELPKANCLARHPDHGWYIPSVGWYDSLADAVTESGPRPDREMEWFGIRDGYAYGRERVAGDLNLGRWNLETGRVEEIARLSDVPLFNVALDMSGRIAALSMYGAFHLFDADNGALTMTRQVPAEGVGHIDCLRLIDRDRLIGTPFITQRFWQGDLRTGEAWDCGRAAPGTGEVLQTWRMGKRIFMAAYTGGELVAYDPDRTARFPENPQVVAQHPLAMRPVAAAQDKRHLYYACSRKYEHLGAVLCGFDTQTRTARWVVDPLGPRRVTSLLLDRKRGELICGSSIHADQRSAEPAVQQCMLARIDVNDLAVRHQHKLDAGPHTIDVIGWIGRDRLLCLESTDRLVPYVVDAETFAPVDVALPPVIAEALAGDRRAVVFTGRVGRFLVHIGDRLELHDLRRRDTLVRVVLKGFNVHRWWLDGDSVLAARRREVYVVDDVLGTKQSTKGV